MNGIQRKKRREGDVISLNLYVYAYFTKTVMKNEQSIIWDLSEMCYVIDVNYFRLLLFLIE